MRRAGLCVLIGLGLLGAFAPRARADDARPAALTIRERKPGTFELRWQTPLKGMARLRVTPRLPPGSVTVDGSFDRRVAGDALIETWRFTRPGGLEGQTISLDGLATSRRGAILHIQLASGSTHRAVLSGARVTFDVPEPVKATRTRWFGSTRGWFLDGLRDGLGWIHVLFAMAIVLAGGRSAWAFALGAFFVADVAGRLLPFALAPSLGHGFVAVAAALAAREAVLGTKRRVMLLAALAGFLHGLSTGVPEALPQAVATALGLDAVHLAIGLVVLLGLRWAERARRPMGYALGVLTFALAVVSAIEVPARAATIERAQATLPMAMVGEAPAASARTAVDGIEVYLDVSVFQTRVEMQARLPALGAWLDLGVSDDPIPVEAQDALLARVTKRASEHLTLAIDGTPTTPVLVRHGFTRRDAVGAYLRDDKVPERVTDAVIGVIYKADTRQIPGTVHLDVRGLPKDTPLRARVLDPEVSQDVALSPEASRITWTNTLESDPLPPIESVKVRTEAFVLPLLGLAVALLATIACLVVLRRRKEIAAVGLRVGLMAACLAMPVGTLSLPSLGETQGELSDQEARAITGTLLDNIYRSFNERGEDEVYDRLALSLSGSELEKAYVENRAALALEEVGLTAHVDVVELRSLKDVVASEDGSFSTDASWTVAGSVTHFGHRHLRQNLYVARLVVRPTDGAWKIDKLEVRQQERIR